MNRTPMNPDEGRERQLERLIDKALRDQPLRRAPASLEASVMAQIAQRAAAPWWQSSFSSWPLAARVAFLVVSIGFAMLVLEATNAIVTPLDPATRGATLLADLAWIPAVFASFGAMLRGLPYGWVLEALLGASLIAQRSLYRHVAEVAKGLEQDGLSGGREAVAMIVGRDPESLDEHGVSRAAIESLAENFSDGVVAPAFWLAIGGLPGIALYKAINTADSMIGHKSDKYRAYGWAAARLDDLVNLPASRLSALLLIIASRLTKGASALCAFAAVERDAGRHRSPNAGWPEAAMAGALGLRLAGPRRYGESWVDDAWMGDGRAEANAEDIRKALALYKLACLILGIAALLGAIALPL